METYQIHFNGIVQGVGFRPLVYRLALQNELNGYVKNDSNGLNVFFNASAPLAVSFFEQLKQVVPARARVISAGLCKVADCTYADFSILVPQEIPECGVTETLKKQVLIAPDIAICEVCRAELHDVNNRRYRYPFITCTQCGPRYSILNQLPYERHDTSMQHFLMCSSCAHEYLDRGDRRFFSQTNSCPDCGIRLSLHDNCGVVISNDTETVLSRLCVLLKSGKIVAVKGIGGYILLCDAANVRTIQLLRKRKHRPKKPFALLYPNISQAGVDFNLNDQERKLLESPAAPIVLLYPKETAIATLAVDAIAPGLGRLGVMIPYNPLFDLIANDFGKPLIATSANISGSPIIYKDNDALSYLFGIADVVISHDREINIPQDDSVVQVSKYAGQQLILRRSRGYAPSFFTAQSDVIKQCSIKDDAEFNARSDSGIQSEVEDFKSEIDQCILATGAFLKSTFTMALHGNVLVSQFLGSGESYESQQMYTDTIDHWLGLYGVKPGLILADRHPGYFAQQYALELAEKLSVKVKLVQHHEAHFAAVLAENNLLYTKDLPGKVGLQREAAVLGVIWDGTGLGHDGHIWGGEFFKYENNEMQRYSHFDYFPCIAGDKMAAEPRIAALCATKNVWPPADEIEEGRSFQKKPALKWEVLLKGKFTAEEWNNYQSLMKATNLFSSSAGRIFDAVASLLGLGDKQSYEGEAALCLQQLAEEYIAENGLWAAENSFSLDDSDLKPDSSCHLIATSALMEGVLIDIEKGKGQKYIAAKFHYSLVLLIGNIAAKIKAKHICFSGGVFQNALLVDWIKYTYTSKYELYFNINLSPNDENISFGQLVYHQHQIRTISLQTMPLETMPLQQIPKANTQTKNPYPIL